MSAVSADQQISFQFLRFISDSTEKLKFILKSKN